MQFAETFIRRALASASLTTDGFSCSPLPLLAPGSRTAGHLKLEVPLRWGIRFRASADPPQSSISETSSTAHPVQPPK